MCAVAEASPTHIITRTSNGSYNLYSVGDDLDLSKVGSGKSPLDYYNMVFGTKKSILKHIAVNVVKDEPTVNELKETAVASVAKPKVDVESKVKAKPKSKDTVVSKAKSKSVGRTSFL